MRRGDVRMVELVPTRGAEANKRRPTTQRVGPLLGRLPTGAMTALDEALRLHLAL
jgi:mRNA-degrading endonuclease toxin of MazEF toxin-antitoxin module